MNGKQLKNSILQWAIQGKLVPQDPNDEPASVLLEKIRQEKERLIKEKKIKRDKNASIIYRGEDNSYYEKILATGEVKCIDAEVPFEIPQGWAWCRLGDVIQLLSGRDLEPYHYNSDGIGIPYMTGASNFCHEELIVNRWTEVPVTVSHIGDLLITCKGTIGTMAFNNIGDIHIARQIMGISSSYVSLKYIKLCLEIHVAELQKAARSIIPGISRDDMLCAIISLPPIEEQHRIVSKIREVLTYVERYTHSQTALNLLNESIKPLLRKSILQEAIQGKLVPQDPSEEPASILLQRIRDEKQRLVKEGKLKKKDVIDSTIFRGDDNKYYEQIGKQCMDITEEIPFEINPSWQWVRLSCVADIYTGNSISESEKKTRFTDVVGRYYIGTKDVGFDNIVSYNNGVAIPKQYEHAFRIAPNHSILMCIEGGSAGRKIAILNQDVCFGNKLCCFSPFIGIGKFIYYYLQSQSFIDMFKANKTGIIGGVSIAKVKEMLMPLPPLQEQQRIVAQIEKLFEQLK